MTSPINQPPGPPGALTGIRVLDLTQVMSGPFCTMMLGDLGADVVKIENPESGDQTRKSWGYAVKGEDSRAFLSLNRNKRSVCLDLKDEADRGDFYALVRTADVVIENFRPGVTTRLGIDYDTLKDGTVTVRDRDSMQQIRILYSTRHYFNLVLVVFIRSLELLPSLFWSGRNRTGACVLFPDQSTCLLAASVVVMH